MEQMNDAAPVSVTSDRISELARSGEWWTEVSVGARNENRLLRGGI